MTFSCDICNQEFTEKRSLIRHAKNHHGNLWSCHHCNQSFNRRDNYEMPQLVCLFKTTRKRSGEHLDMTAKNRVGGALDGTLVDYRPDLGGQQDASNVLNVLKESTFQRERKISEEN